MRKALSIFNQVYLKLLLIIGIEIKRIIYYNISSKAVKVKLDSEFLAKNFQLYCHE